MPNGTKEVKTAPEPEAQFLEYLNTEIAQLESRESRLEHLRSVRAALTGQKVTAVPSTNSGPRRGRRGNRLGEFLGLVNAKPGITIAEAAKEMNIQPNYLYRLKSKALTDKTIRVEGQGVFPVEQAEVSEPIAA